MKQFFDRKVNRIVCEIIAGELVSTDNPQSLLTTLLGSCVSVCLSDKKNGVYGMNHFMLPGKFQQGQPVLTGDPKYGTCATDLLIEDMIKKGANRKYLEAKVFGAGNVLDKVTFSIAQANADFIQKYLQALRIPVLASDLGRKHGRKIMFLCGSGEVFVKRITDMSTTPEAIEKERRFYEWFRKQS